MGPGRILAFKYLGGPWLVVAPGNPIQDRPQVQHEVIAPAGHELAELKAVCSSFGLLDHRIGLLDYGNSCHPLGVDEDRQKTGDQAPRRRADDKKEVLRA